MGHARETLRLQRVAPAVQSRLLCRAGIELLIGIYPTRSLQWKGWISLKHCGQRALFFSFLFFFMLQRSKIWITLLRCKPTYGHDRDKSAALATVFLCTVPAYRVTSSRGLQARQIPLCCLLAFILPNHLSQLRSQPIELKSACVITGAIASKAYSCAMCVQLSVCLAY
jgi:hypothetical protein